MTRSSPTDQPLSSTPARHALLRAEVGRLRRLESRRIFDASVHVGRLGGERTGFVVRAQDRPAFDAALRVDVVSALVAESPASWVTAWLVRPGAPDPHEHDLEWFAACRRGFAIHGRTLAGCYVVTRYGWRDLLTDEARTWVRLRV